jgi:soluble lytic murein transglycosylase-like protein
MSDPRHLTFTLATLLFAAGAGAAPSPSSPYRLQLSGQCEYRLADPQPLRPRGPSPAALARKPYAREIEQAARRNQLDPALVHAVIHVESRHQAAAVSSKGAIGLMQVLPATAERFGISEPGDPTANVAAGTRYLRRLLDQFDQRLDLALAAYNAGEGAVVRHGNRIPPYRETRDYVPSVMEKYREWLGIQPSPVSYLSGTRLDARAVAGLAAD